LKIPGIKFEYIYYQSKNGSELVRGQTI